MPIGAASYRQVLTVWESTGQDGYGAPTFSTPKKVPCRWEDKNEEFVNDAGEKMLAHSLVWTYEDLDVGAWVALGDHTAQSDPTTIPRAFRVQRSDEIPDLRGLNREHRHYL